MGLLRWLTGARSEPRELSILRRLARPRAGEPRAPPPRSPESEARGRRLRKGEEEGSRSAGLAALALRDRGLVLDELASLLRRAPSEAALLVLALADQPFDERVVAEVLGPDRDVGYRGLLVRLLLGLGPAGTGAALQQLGGSGFAPTRAVVLAEEVVRASGAPAALFDANPEALEDLDLLAHTVGRELVLAAGRRPSPAVLEALAGSLDPWRESAAIAYGYRGPLLSRIALGRTWAARDALVVLPAGHPAQLEVLRSAEHEVLLVAAASGVDPATSLDRALLALVRDASLPSGLTEAELTALTIHPCEWLRLRAIGGLPVCPGSEPVLRRVYASAESRIEASLALDGLSDPALPSFDTRAHRSPDGLAIRRARAGHADAVDHWLGRLAALRESGAATELRTVYGTLLVELPAVLGALDARQLDALASLEDYEGELAPPPNQADDDPAPEPFLVEMNVVRDAASGERRRRGG